MSDAAPKFVFDDRFIEPFANRPHTVYGKRLFPFSLWCQFNLELAQSPFLLGDRAATPYDLWVAVRCCSSAWSPEHYVPDLKPPGKLRWLWQVGRFNFAEELRKFLVYFEDFCVGPKFWPNQHKGSSEAARDLDENLELAVHLEMELGLSPREVWTMPLGQVRWRSATITRLKGGELDFWTPMDEVRFQEHVKKREAGIDARANEILAANPALTFETARKQAHDEHWAKHRAALDRKTTPKNGNRPRAN